MMYVLTAVHSKKMLIIMSIMMDRYSFHGQEYLKNTSKLKKKF